jgi:hypothetical protein
MLDSVFYFSQKFWVFQDVFTSGAADHADLAALRSARHELQLDAARGRRRRARATCW